MSLLLSVLSIAAAQAPSVSPCPAMPTRWSAWWTPTAGSLAIGRAARVQVAEGSGFMASFMVTRAGSYEIALSNGGWIDVVRDGQALRSTSHRHGPACSSIRKVVSFALRPGRHELRLSRVAGEAIVLIVPAP